MSIIRSSNIKGYVPTVNQLPLGDIFINEYDGKLFIKRTTDKTRSIIEIGSGGSTNTDLFVKNASFSNPNIIFTRGNDTTFSVNISGLTVISASYATNSTFSVSSSYAATASYATNFKVSGSIFDIDYIDFDTTSAVTQPTTGRLSWNNTDGTLDLGLKGGNVTLQVGQENVIRVVNKTGADLLESDFRVVRVRSVSEGGAQGQRLAVKLAQADSDADSATTLGVVTENINNNQEGFITIFGEVKQIDTTGAKSYGGLETWVDGDMLYLSPFYPGYLTNVKPTAPNHLVIVGYVEYAHANNGKIFVKIDNGWEIGELHDVKDTTTSGSYGDLLIKSGSIWTNSKQLTGSYELTGSLAATSFTGSLLGTASSATTASNTILQNQILTNQTVGALPSGTTLPVGTGLESILRTMLVTYIPPTLSSLVMRNGGSNISTAARDVGDSFITNTASFSATADNPTGIFPISSSWTASGADIGTQTFYFGNNVLSTSNIRSIGSNYTINRATSNGTVTFTVNGRRSDTGAAITGATTSISFQWRNYLAASSTIPTNNTTAQTVVGASVTSTLDTDRVWTATCTVANDTTGNFTYIIYPASYGNLSNIIQNGALSVLSAFTNLGDFTITNAFGASILVRIYKSNSDKAFASGTTLAIS